MITELWIEPEPRFQREQVIVKTHARYKGSRFTVAEDREFDTPEAATEWMRERIAEGARWVRTDLLPSRLLANHPDIRAWKTADGLTLTVDGSTIASGITDPAKLKELILEHPASEALRGKPCSRCFRRPVINFTRGTLTHLHDDCQTRIRIELPTVPLALKIAAWDHYFADRARELELDPVTIPHLLELEILREPTQGELIRRIQKIEVL